MAKSSWAQGTSLNSELRERLIQLIAEHGERAVAKMLEVSTTAVTRGAAGCGLRQGTRFLLESKLTRAAA